MSMRVWMLILCLCLPALASSQVNKFIEQQKPPVTQQPPDVHYIFQKIEKGISSNSVSTFSGQLGSQVLVSIRGRDDGYFSRNQTASVIQNYLFSLKPISFGFSKLQESGENPYATGQLMYTNKGNQEFVQVYVSLSFHDSKWVISQFSIY